MAASWTGFRDYESGIAAYEVTLSTHPATTVVTVINSDFQYTRRVPSDPNVRFINVGLHLSASLPISTFPGMQLVHGQRYYVFVRAINGAGYASDVVMSDGFVVDLTPPLITVCMPSMVNLIAAPSFEFPALGVWSVTGGTAPLVAAATTRLDTPDKSLTFVHLAVQTAVLSQTIVTVPGTRYRLSFAAAGYPRRAIQGQAGRVRIAALDKTFLLSEGHVNGFWRTFAFEFAAESNVTVLQLNALGNGFDKLLAVDAVSLYACLQTATQAELTNTIKLSTGREFAALDGRAVDARALSCQTQPLALPPGWTIASDDTVARRVAAENYWGAACVVLNTGLSYFTLSRSAVAGTSCGVCAGGSCLQSGNSSLLFAPTECASVSRVVLIERLDAMNPGKSFQNTRSHMQTWWIATDPESDIDEYKWALGTIPGGSQLLLLRVSAARQVATRTVCSCTTACKFTSRWPPPTASASPSAL